MQKLPQNLTAGVYEPEAANLYTDPMQMQIAAAYGFESVCGEHNLRDKTLAFDPVAAELARANAEFWAQQGVATIRRNDFMAARKYMVEHLSFHHNSAYWRICREEQRAMAPAKQPKPAEVVSITDLRKAREGAAARAEADRLRDALTVEDNGQLSMRM